MPAPAASAAPARWSAETADAVRALDPDAVPDPAGLAEIAAVWVDAAVRGDPAAIHGLARSRGGVLSPEAAKMLRDRLRSAPPESRPPNIDAMTDDEVFARTEGRARPMSRFVPRSVVVRLVDPADRTRGEAFPATPGDPTAEQKRTALTWPSIWSGSTLAPPGATGAEDIPRVVIDFLGACPKGEPAWVTLRLGFYRGQGWLPLAASARGESRYLPPK